VRICLIGKFPPIEGGVSMRTYWVAHALARRGHNVEVITNAKEVEPPFRMLMRGEDWGRCDASYGDGSVTVRWTDPVDASQTYIPMASPFVSKLVSLAAQAHREQPFDVVHSFYMEPYGIAAHLVAEMVQRPHVLRMAGSDAGRLWHHPQFAPLYDHVLRSADAVLASGEVARRAIARGIDPSRIFSGGNFTVPEDVFTPVGPVLDIATLRREAEADPRSRALVWGKFAGEYPHFGIYGKIGTAKGSFALLEAMARLKQEALNVGLVALAHGSPPVEKQFRERAAALGLEDRVLQLPFLPHWRVPEFLRGCRAVCCLEQGFPIAFHTPIVAREVLLAGSCLVGSAEILRKVPGHERLPSGFGCVAIADVKDVAVLARQLGAILRDPAPLADIAARGRAFAHELQCDMRFPEVLEAVLAAAARRDLRVLPVSHKDGPARTSPPPRPFHEVVKQVDVRGSILPALAEAVRIERAITAIGEEAAKTQPDVHADPLFRLTIRRWGLTRDDLAGLIPIRAPNLRIIASDCDLREIIDAKQMEDLPATPTQRRTFVAVRGARDRGNPLVLDALTAHILDLCDGKHTVAEIIACLGGASDEEARARHFPWLEALFANRLIEFRAPAQPR
jgi:glycosyltransferase involved in cell wall biosynthesis